MKFWKHGHVSCTAHFSAHGTMSTSQLTCQNAICTPRKFEHKWGAAESKHTSRTSHISVFHVAYVRVAPLATCPNPYSINYVWLTDLYTSSIVVVTHVRISCIIKATALPVPYHGCGPEKMVSPFAGTHPLLIASPYMSMVAGEIWWIWPLSQPGSINHKPY